MRKQLTVKLILIVLCCAAMLAVDGLWQPGYWIKSGVKILLFLGLPLLSGCIFRDTSFRMILRLEKEGLKRALLLGISVYLVIIGAYFVLRDAVDFSPVLDNLPDGVTKTTFPFVALYISFVNSLLEEFFFRGFAYLSLRKYLSGASLFSAAVFAIYHTAMMLGWFPPIVFAIAMAGLTVGGMLFNRIDDRDETIYTGWIVHMFANFAINTVGMILFYQ